MRQIGEKAAVVFGGTACQWQSVTADLGRV
jgi:hypothetical protein